MIDPSRIETLIHAALVADSYSLGLHWIYDHDLLDSQPLDNNCLNPPLSHWHGTKQAGDLTHYGDQLWHLYSHIRQHDALDMDQYRRDWMAFIQHYHGYIDKATAETLRNITHDVTPPGSHSTELSVTARIVCPLLYARTQSDYLEHVEALTRFTHNSALAVQSSQFFASVLLSCLCGTPLPEALTEHLELLPDKLRISAQAGIDSAEQDTVAALRHFGIACDIRHGLPGVLHLISRHRDEPTTLLKENARAGGDSSARAMISLMLLIAEDPKRYAQVPTSWQLNAVAASFSKT